MDIEIEQEKERAAEWIRLLGSKDFLLEYDPDRPWGIRWLAVLNDKEAVCHVAGTFRGKPSSYGWSARDVFMKVRACLPPQPVATTADMERLGIRPGNDLPKGRPLHTKASNTSPQPIKVGV